MKHEVHLPDGVLPCNGTPIYNRLGQPFIRACTGKNCGRARFMAMGDPEGLLLGVLSRLNTVRLIPSEERVERRD